MTKIKDRLSWSSLSTYMGCGERWRLERVYHLDNATWYATLAGTAVHEVTETLDRTGEVVDLTGATKRFVEVFNREIQENRDNGVEIKASGRVGKNITKTGGPNKKDYDWWLHFGPEYVLNWQAMRRESDWSIAELKTDQYETDPEEIQYMPAIELEFEIPLGGTNVRGYIDRVFHDPTTDQMVVVDLKTGARPLTPLQLAVYRLGLQDAYGLEANFGAYWIPHEVDAEKGKDGFGQIYDLTTWTREYVDHLFRQARTGIEAGIFLPSPTSMCVGCSVRSHCRAFGGAAVDPRVLEPLVPVVENVELVSEWDLVSGGE